MKCVISRISECLKTSILNEIFNLTIISGIFEILKRTQRKKHLTNLVVIFNIEDFYTKYSLLVDVKPTKLLITGTSERLRILAGLNVGQST